MILPLTQCWITLKNNIKRAIKTPLFKQYNSNQARPVLQKISFLDPRYRSHYIELAQKDFIIRLIKQEMDENEYQIEVDEHDKNTNIGCWSNNNYWNNKQNNMYNLFWLNVYNIMAAFFGNLPNIPVETNSIQYLNQIELDKFLLLPSVGLHIVILYNGGKYSIQSFQHSQN